MKSQPDRMRSLVSLGAIIVAVVVAAYYARCFHRYDYWMMDQAESSAEKVLWIPVPFSHASEGQTRRLTTADGISNATWFIERAKSGHLYSCELAKCSGYHLRLEEKGLRIYEVVNGQVIKPDHFHGVAIPKYYADGLIDAFAPYESWGQD